MEHSRLIKACLLRAIGTSLIVATDTYVYMLFLSSYPNTYIPYLYIVLGVFAFITMRLVQPYLKRDLTKFMLTSHLIFIVLLLSFVFLVKQPWHWVPFLISVGVLTTVTMANTTDWIVVQSLFTLREFKVANKTISLTSTLGVVLIGSLIPLILSIFPPISILYLTIGLFVASVLIEKFMHTPLPMVEVIHKEQPSVAVHTLPLYLYTFIALLLMLQLFSFSDFSFKSQLSIQYDQKGMGQFLAPFFAVTNAITLLLQLFVTPTVLRRFGVVGLIMTTPIVFIIIAVALFIAPSLWTAAALAGAANILRYSFFLGGTQMTYNVYPPATRNLVQYQMQSLGRGLGIALGGVTLILLRIWGADLKQIAVATVIMSAVMIYVTIQLRKHYYLSLKSAINLHHFDTENLDDHANEAHLIFETATQALKEKDEEVQLFGLTLLGRLKLKSVPEAVIQSLFSEFNSVEMAAINIIQSCQDERVVPSLMKKLMSEKKPDTIQALVDTIVQYSPQSLLPYAISGISSDEPAIKAAAITVFLKAGTPEQIQIAQSTFESMVYRSDAQYRYHAATVLTTVVVENWHTFILQLFNDPDPLVVRTVLTASSLQPDEDIIDQLISKLEDRTLTHLAGTVLVSIGARALPNLLVAIHRLKTPYPINTTLLLLAKFPEPEAEMALLELLKTDNFSLLEMCAICLAYRSRKFPLSPKAKTAIHNHIFAQVQKIKDLSQSAHYYQDDDITNEIRWRIFYAKKLYLYLLAARSRSTIVLQIIPTLLKANRTSTAYSTAIELLELSLANQEIKNTLTRALEENTLSPISKPLPDQAFDTWLKEVLDFKQGKLKGDKMSELISRALVLRKVTLFSSLPAELLQTIAEILQQKNCAANEVLFQEGDWGDGMYIVAKGSVNLLQKNKQFSVCGDDSFFGELALLDDEPRFATAIAAEDSKLFFIEKSEFIRLTDEVPAILRAVTQAVVSYLRHPISNLQTSLQGPEASIHEDRMK